MAKYIERRDIYIQWHDDEDIYGGTTPPLRLKNMATLHEAFNEDFFSRANLLRFNEDRLHFKDCVIVLEAVK